MQRSSQFPDKLSLGLTKGENCKDSKTAFLTAPCSFAFPVSFVFINKKSLEGWKGVLVQPRQRERYIPFTKMTLQSSRHELESCHTRYHIDFSLTRLFSILFLGMPLPQYNLYMTFAIPKQLGTCSHRLDHSVCKAQDPSLTEARVHRAEGKITLSIWTSAQHAAGTGTKCQTWT